MGKTFSINSHVRSMIDEDGAVLLDLKAGKYFSLNGVAAAIWERVEQGQDRNQILDELSSLYRVEQSRLEADLVELAEGLEKKGLVRVGA